VLLLLSGVIVALISGSLPAFRAYGLDFLTTEVWNPVTEKFGALPAIYGTLVSSAIAMLIGIPLAFGTAVFLGINQNTGETLTMLGTAELTGTELTQLHSVLQHA